VRNPNSARAISSDWEITKSGRRLRRAAASFTLRESQRGSAKVGPNKRHQEIYAAYCHGEAIEQLAERFNIKVGTVASILMAEKHRHAVSQLPEYKAARQFFGQSTMH
jgi:hypothetical protein